MGCSFVDSGVWFDGKVKMFRELASCEEEDESLVLEEIVFSPTKALSLFSPSLCGAFVRANLSFHSFTVLSAMG